MPERLVPRAAQLLGHILDAAQRLQTAGLKAGDKGATILAEGIRIQRDAEALRKCLYQFQDRSR